MQLDDFNTQQQILIIKLTKQVQDLEDKNIHLQKMLDSTVSHLDFETRLSDEEMIAREQLKRLNSVSQERDLTLEEARRTEIYTKILASLNLKNKSIDAEFKELDNKQLLQLVQKNETP